MSDAKAPPRVFVSYTHESPDHRRWALGLATELRNRGIDAMLDQWDLRPGEDVLLFMERAIREADRVLLICTPEYKRRADEAVGGVGYERNVVTASLAQNQDTHKFVCLLRHGTKSNAVPVFAQNRLYLDFSLDSGFEQALDELARDILEAPAIAKPRLGANPYITHDDSIGLDGAARLRSSIDTPISTEAVFTEATQILSRKDLVLWQQLSRRTRRSIKAALSAAGQSAQSGSTPNFRALLDIAAPLMLLGLTAADSRLPEVADQRSLLDEFNTIETWPRSGLASVIATPSALALAYHYLLGAVLSQHRAYAEVFRLARTEVQDSFQDGGYGPLWRTHRLMGWNEALEGSCDKSWEIILGLYNSCPWLEHLFVDEKEYARSVRTYQFLCSLLEMSERGASADWGIDVPPMYVLPRNGSERNLVAELARSVFQTKEDATLIAGLLDIEPEHLNTLWSAWSKVIGSVFQNDRRFWFAVRDLPHKLI